MESEFQVKTDIFEGPLDTLLILIEKRKLFINDISLAQVADDYIAYVKSLENFPLNTNEISVERPQASLDSRGLAVADLAHFILIASTLVLIKSKSLLPTLILTEEEETSIDDLEARLREYQKYKALSRHLQERFGINIQYAKLPSRQEIIVFSPDKNVNVAKLHEVVKSVLEQIPKQEFVPKTIVQKVISLEEMIKNLSKRITENIKMSFKEFSGIGKAEKVEVIVSFLAMLELIKQGIIEVRQHKEFHDIEMESQYLGVPRY